MVVEGSKWAIVVIVKKAGSGCWWRQDRKGQGRRVGWEAAQARGAADAGLQLPTALE